MKKQILKSVSRGVGIGLAVGLALWLALGRPARLPDDAPGRDTVAMLVEEEKASYLKQERPYSSLLSALAKDDVSVLAIATDGELLVRTRSNDRYYVHAPAPTGLLTDALAKARGNNALVVTLRVASVKPPVDFASGLADGSRALVQLLLVGFLIAMLRGSLGVLGGSKPFELVEDPGVRFGDVIGAEDAKDALKEVVAYLKAPERFAKMGARAPRGVLMEGPPGSGKTLLAKAVAGECGVPFLVLNGSSFTSTFVGVGVARVKKVFKEAAKHAPCVVFIDEIDGLGTREGSGHGGAVETENRRIINAILTELDGFDARAGIVVIGATNYGAHLDAGLTREGRFDRKCSLGLPNVKERQAIFELHAGKIPVATDVDWARLARLSAGMAPSAISTVVNFAAFDAAQDGREEVTQEDLQRALERQQLGTPAHGLTRAMSPEVRQRVAVHEAGHALIGWKTGMGTLDGVTIIPRSRALGVTLLTQEHDDLLLTEKELRSRIATLLAGREAERLVLGSVSTGATNDLERASHLALAMVSEAGMAGPFGPFSFKALGQQSETLARSKAMAAAVDLLKEEELVVSQSLAEHRLALDALTQALLNQETLTGDEARAILERLTV